jgi:hypothetical protein
MGYSINFGFLMLSYKRYYQTMVILGFLNIFVPVTNVIGINYRWVYVKTVVSAPRIAYYINYTLKNKKTKKNGCFL